MEPVVLKTLSSLHSSVLVLFIFSPVFCYDRHRCWSMLYILPLPTPIHITPPVSGYHGYSHFLGTYKVWFTVYWALNGGVFLESYPLYMLSDFLYLDKQIPGLPHSQYTLQGRLDMIYIIKVELDWEHHLMFVPVNLSLLTNDRGSGQSLHMFKVCFWWYWCGVI